MTSAPRRLTPSDQRATKAAWRDIYAVARWWRLPIPLPMPIPANDNSPSCPLEQRAKRGGVLSRPPSEVSR